MDRRERNRHRIERAEEDFLSELESEQPDPEAQAVLEEAYRRAKAHTEARKRALDTYYNELSARHEAGKLDKRTAQCWICGLVRPTHLHHIDRNRSNNLSINLAVICEECHVALHKLDELPDNEELAAMREHLKQRYPDRFDSDAPNPFERPNSRGSANEQFVLFSAGKS